MQKQVRRNEKNSWEGGGEWLAVSKKILANLLR